MTALSIAITLISAYVLGSVPTAYIVGRLRKKADIRQVGTRNMGAMNVFYEVGFVWGLLVLATDILKGAAAMAVADAFGFAGKTYLGVDGLVYLGAGIAAVLGHNYPVFLNFKGGKGGATAIGVLIYLMWPWSFPINTALFGLLFLLTRTPTISYSLAFICYPFISWYAFHRWDWIVFTVVLLMLPLIKYIPRIREMRDKAGNWRRVFQRKSVSDRF